MWNSRAAAANACCRAPGSGAPAAAGSGATARAHTASPSAATSAATGGATGGATRGRGCSRWDRRLTTWRSYRAFRCRSVFETDRLLDHSLQRLLGRRDGQALEPVLGVVDGLAAEPLLEHGVRRRPAGLAHVEVAAAGGAGVLYGMADEEARRLVALGPLVHRRPEAVGVGSLQDHVRRDGTAVHPRQPQAAPVAEGPRHCLELLEGVPVMKAAPGKPERLGLAAGPAGHRPRHPLRKGRH